MIKETVTEQVPEDGQKKNIWKQILPGVLVSVIVVVLLLVFVDVGEAINAIQQADYRWFPLVILLFLGTLTTRAIAWRGILKNEITWKRTFWTLTEGYLLNNVLPFRLGELGRVLILSSTEKLDGWRVLSSIMVERIFDVALMAGLLLATAPFVVGMENAMQTALIAGGVVILGFIVLFFSAKFPQKILDLFAWFTQRLPRIKDFGLLKLDSLLEGLSVLAEWQRFLYVAFWMTITWVFNVGWYFALLQAFVPKASLLLAGFTVGASSLGVALPSAPGSIGTFHVAVIGALEVFNVDRPVAVGFAVLSHLNYMIITSILGSIAISRDGLSVLGLFNRLQNQKQSLSEK